MLDALLYLCQFWCFTTNAENRSIRPNCRIVCDNKLRHEVFDAHQGIVIYLQTFTRYSPSPGLQLSIIAFAFTQYAIYGYIF